MLCRCFLLTPKLLPDLEYSEACSILNIMNGPWIEQPSKGMMLLNPKLHLFFSYLNYCPYNLQYPSFPNSVWSNGDCWGTVVDLLGKSRC